MNTVTYSWSWRILALFRHEQYDWGGGSQRIFSLWPPLIWSTAKYKWFMWRHGGDPFAACERWLKQNRHWNDADFMRAICWWYANRSEPGQLVRLNPKLFMI